MPDWVTHPTSPLVSVSQFGCRWVSRTDVRGPTPMSRIWGGREPIIVSWDGKAETVSTMGLVTTIFSLYFSLKLSSLHPSRVFTLTTTYSALSTVFPTSSIARTVVFYNQTRSKSPRIFKLSTLAPTMFTTLFVLQTSLSTLPGVHI